MREEKLVSARSFADTVTHLRQSLEKAGMKVFAEIDHQQAAKESGLDMQPATVLVFGTPKAGTPLMVKDPVFALRLPLKVLITEVNGEVLVLFEKTESLLAGSGIEMADVEKTLARVSDVIPKIVHQKD